MSRKSIPRPAAIRLPPPPEFDPEAAVIWREVVAYLGDAGALLKVDAGTIETYCLAVVRQRRLCMALDEGGLIDKDGKPNPLLRTIEATATTVKNLGHVLRLNPTARKAPISGDQTKGKTAWSGVLK